MSIVYGKDYQINPYVAGTPNTYAPLGGTVYEPTLDPNATIVTEVGCGEGARTIAAQKIVAVKPALRFTMNLRRLEDYITTKAIITAEGAVPAHNLMVKIGTEYYDLVGWKVNTCRVTIRQMESIKAALEILGKDIITGASWTFEKRTEDAMWKDAVAELKIATTDIANWREVEFGVDNKVLQEILGTAIKPTELGEREAIYTGHILRAHANSSYVPTVMAGTTNDVIVKLTDKQATPVSKTVTFADAYMKTARLTGRGLEMVVERIDWESKSLAIT